MEPQNMGSDRTETRTKTRKRERKLAARHPLPFFAPRETKSWLCPAHTSLAVEHFFFVYVPHLPAGERNPNSFSSVLIRCRRAVEK
jgi:hypothetical protein